MNREFRKTTAILLRRRMALLKYRRSRALRRMHEEEERGTALGLAIRWGEVQRLNLGVMYTKAELDQVEKRLADDESADTDQRSMALVTSS